jgi:predicted DNA-binding transcriptional regulator YafY
MSFRNKALDLVELMKTRKRGVRRKDLEIRWSCAPATVRRVVQEAKVDFGLPIFFDASKGVYLCDAEKAIELPGLWFGDGELAALLGLTHWLDTQGSGILSDLLDPLRARIESMLKDRGIGLDDWRERVRLLPMASRPIQPELLISITKAVLGRKRLVLFYMGVHDPESTEREVSPQTLVRYRDNWLLDAFCHKQNALRSFALSRIKDARPLAEAAQEISRKELDRHFSEAYGIFGGRARYQAVLVFEGLAARLVESESWHPRQKLQALPGGKVRLEFPCADLRELVRDIMRYADEVTVERPEALRLALSQMIARAAQRKPDRTAKDKPPLPTRAGHME